MLGVGVSMTLLRAYRWKSGVDVAATGTVAVEEAGEAAEVCIRSNSKCFDTRKGRVKLFKRLHFHKRGLNVVVGGSWRSPTPANGSNRANLTLLHHLPAPGSEIKFHEILGQDSSLLRGFPHLSELIY